MGGDTEVSDLINRKEEKKTISSTGKKPRRPNETFSITFIFNFHAVLTLYLLSLFVRNSSSLSPSPVPPVRHTKPNLAVTRPLKLVLMSLELYVSVPPACLLCIRFLS